MSKFFVKTLSIFVMCAFVLGCFFLSQSSATTVSASTKASGKTSIYVGYARRSILPPEGRFVQLQGQADLRLVDRNNKDSDIYTSVIVIESRVNGVTKNLSVWVGLDLTCGPQYAAQKIVKSLNAKGMKNISRDMIMISATHTHRSPFALTADKADKLGFPYYLRDGDKTNGEEPKLMTPEEYIDDAQDTIPGWDGYLGLTADAIKEVWNTRVQASIGAGTTQLNFGNPRFTLYWNSTQNKIVTNGFGEYANIKNPNYRSVLNNNSDWDVQTVGFWDAKGKLIALAAGVHSPAQIDDKSSKISADFWKDVRAKLPAKLGISGEVPLLPWCLTAGDLGPLNPFSQNNRFTTYEKAGEMLSTSIKNAYTIAKANRKSSAELKSDIVSVPLKLKKLTAEQYREALDKIEYYKVKYRHYLDWNADPVYGLNTWKWATKTSYDTDKVPNMKIRMADGSIEERDPNQPGAPNDSFWWEAFEIRSAKATKIIYEKQLKSQGTAFNTYVGHAITIGDIGIGSFPAEMYSPYGMMLKSWANFKTVIPVQLEGFWDDTNMGYCNNPEAEEIASYGNSADMGAIETGEGYTFTNALATKMNVLNGNVPSKDYSKVAIISGGLTGYYLAPDGFTELKGDKRNIGISSHPSTNDTKGTVLGIGTFREYNWGGYSEFFGSAANKRPKIYAFAQSEGWFDDNSSDNKSYSLLIKRIKDDMGGKAPKKIIITQEWSGDASITHTKKLVEYAMKEYPEVKIYIINAIAIARSAPRQNNAVFPYNAWYNWTDSSGMAWVAKMKDTNLVKKYNTSLEQLIKSKGGKVTLIDINKYSGLKGSDGYLKESCAAMNGFGMQLNIDGIKLLGDYILSKIN